jgi:hypothetical protein
VLAVSDLDVKPSEAIRKLRLERDSARAIAMVFGNAMMDIGEILASNGTSFIAKLDMIRAIDTETRARIASHLVEIQSWCGPDGSAR